MQIIKLIPKSQIGVLFAISITLIIVLFMTTFLVLPIIYRQSTPAPLPSPPALQSPKPKPFPTISSFEDQVEAQSKADYEYGVYIKELYTNYPWFNKLPLQNDIYFVYFDTDDKTFKANIYLNKNYIPATNENVNKYKNEIISELEKLGISPDQYEIEWRIK